MKRLYFLPFIITALFFTACGDSPEGENENPTPTPPTPPAEVEVDAPKNVTAMDGLERVKLVWEVDSDAKVTKTLIYYGNSNSYKEFPINSNSASNKHEIIIESLDEGEYTYQIANQDKDGNESPKISITAKAYGEEYISQLETRGISKIEHDNKAKVATLTLEAWNQGDKSVITYKHVTKGNTVTVDVNHSDETLTLNDIGAEQPFEIYTLYTPENCMDQMQSAKQSYSTPEAPSQPATSTLDINVMQFNVATGNALTALTGASHMWSERFPKIAAMIKDNNIDIIGLQELRDSPNYYYKNLIDQLGSSYAGVCYARTSSYDKEGLAIIYRKDKFDLVREGRYWLNMTDPDTELILNSGGYAANFYRIAVYAILREKTTGQEIYFTTTHLDNNDAGNGIIKTWQAQILINHTNARSGYNDGANRFLIVTGDMNSNPEREAMQRFTSTTQNYIDTWSAAASRKCPNPSIPRSTMVDIDGDKATQNNACFDYIYAKGGNPQVLSHTTHEAKSGNTILSDHNAVSVTLRYNISK